MTKRRTDSRTRHAKSPPSENGPLVAYYSTIGIFLLGIAIPHTRVWGFNWWAYQPTVVQVLLFALALGAGPLLLNRSKQIKQPSSDSSSENSSRSFWIFALVATICLTAIYAAFPSRTHFLGDGYQLLSRLANEGGTIKSWDIGASRIMDVVLSLLGERSEANALLAFRIVAVGSGFLMLLLTAWISRLLFEQSINRILFFLGIASCGYTLQFFGYVEHYALFIVSVAAFTFLGMTGLMGKTPRWLAIPPVLIASVLHIFGLALLPPLLYVLFYDKKPFAEMAGMSGKAKAITVSVVAAVALAIYFYLFYNYYFFRFAFLPMVPDRFTVDNDYLLSPKHVIDFVNLLVILVPGIGLFVLEVLAGRRKWLWDSPPKRFLLAAVASTSLCIYVFNPGIGMPRNWDLYSLPGIPLSVLVFYSLLAAPRSENRRFLAAGLAIALGFLLLIPRVTSQSTPDTAIRHFQDYVELDRKRNRNSRSLLTDYYRAIGDEVAAQKWNSLALQEFPAASLTNQGKQQLQAGHIDQAAALFRRAIEINPIFFDAYSNLATCYINKGQLDEAMELLRIADGLNPLNTSVLNNKGAVYQRLGEYEQARKQFQRVLAMDSTHVNAMIGMVTVCLPEKDDQGAYQYLTRLGRDPSVPMGYFQQGAEACAEDGLIQSARLCFQIASQRGAGGAWQQDMLTKYPDLQN